MDDPTSRRHGGRHSQVARQQVASATIRDSNIHCLAQQMPVSVYVQLVIVCTLCSALLSASCAYADCCERILC
jgi:hypothetical protein